MDICYLCGNILTEDNVSEEHIIINALGGKLKSRKLLCKDCNNKTGQNADSRLAKQFEFFSAFLQIDRDRGKPLDFEFNQRNNGDNYVLKPTGEISLKHPNLKKVVTKNGAKYNIRANNSMELNAIIEKIESRYNGKLITLDRGTDDTVIDLDKDLVFNTTGFLGILKMAINLYIEKTSDIVSVKEAIEDLKTDKIRKVDHIILENDLYNPSKNEISHLIYINGSDMHKKLYAIIELFNTKQYIVKLNDNFQGNNVEIIYIFDIVKKDIIKHDIINIPPADFIFAYEYAKSKPNFGFVQKKMERIMDIRYKLNIVNYIFKEYYQEQNTVLRDFLTNNEKIIKESLMDAL